MKSRIAAAQRIALLSSLLVAGITGKSTAQPSGQGNSPASLRLTLGGTTCSATSTITFVGGILSCSGSTATYTPAGGAIFGTVTPTAGNLFVGSGTDWDSVAVSEDATMASTGALTVIGLQTRDVSNAAPGTGDLFQWSGTQWEPVTTLTGAYTFTGNLVFGNATTDTLDFTSRLNTNLNFVQGAVTRTITADQTTTLSANGGTIEVIPGTGAAGSGGTAGANGGNGRFRGGVGGAGTASAAAGGGGLAFFDGGTAGANNGGGGGDGGNANVRGGAGTGAGNNGGVNVGVTQSGFVAIGASGIKTTIAGETAFVNTAIVATAPTISSGFGTTPSISASNGTIAFRINVGTGGTASSGVIGLPTVTTGWNCYCNDTTTASATVFLCKQTAGTTASATVGNFDALGAAAAWAASDILTVSCFAY